MKVPCPICQTTLQPSGNPNIHTCGPRKIPFPDGSLLEMSHASVFTDADGNQTYKKLIVPPYSFEIFDEPQNQKTVIKMLKRTLKAKWDHSKNRSFEWDEILTIQAAVTLPWHDIAKVNNAVRTYLVFS